MISRDYYIYATDIPIAYGTPKVSINSTVGVKYQGQEAPYWGGYNEFSGFFNNNSYSLSTGFRSCFCHVKTNPNSDDIN